MGDLNNNNNNKYIIGSIIGIVGVIMLAIIAVKKFKKSTPRNSRSQSPNSSTMEELGPYKCLRRNNETSDSREKYLIFRSYNSMDGSWRLDRKNGGNRSLNETDIRKAMIGSRFHHDDESAKGCCYNSSNFIQEKSTEEIFCPEPYIDLTGTGVKIIPQ